MPGGFPYNPKVFRFNSGLCKAAYIYHEGFSEESGMNRTRRAASPAVVAALCLSLGSTARTQTQTAAQAAPAGQEAPQGKQPYTLAEYNSYQACASDKNPAPQVKCFDDFVSKYPNSQLLIYVYPQYVQAYSVLKNYPKVIEFADKTAALGDKVDAATRYNAYYTHAVAYSSMLSDPAVAKDVNQAKAAMEAANNALKTLPEVKKPDNVTDDAFAAQVKQVRVTLNTIGAQAATIQKDSAKAIEYYKAVLELNPDDVVANYRLGQAYLAMQPPQPMDAFWYVARGAASKAATQQQKKQLTDYLRKLIVNYQQAACDSLTDAELNELLQLAASSATKPDTYKLPSVEDLNNARKDMTIASVIADLKAGGDKAKVTWLAACGLEFPDVPGKVIEVTPSADSVVFKVAFVTSEEEFNAATTPNMEVKVVGQPEAARVEKDSAFHFTATLVSYDPDPAFMIHWDKGKVKVEDIPPDKEKKTPKKTPARRPPARKPSGR
jgi:tetratricopeptide (TPR) repeat protein